MKTRIAPVSLLMLVLVVLSGCAQRYAITLSNGSRLISVGKPKLKDGSYVGKDAGGNPIVVSAGRVREISPASMVEEESSRFTPKKR